MQKKHVDFFDTQNWTSKMALMRENKEKSRDGHRGF